METINGGRVADYSIDARQAVRARLSISGQLAGARVDRRRMTGVGVFVDLLVAGDADRVNEINSEISAAYPTSLAAPCDLVGFTLFIRGGCLSFLEGYTFGDVKWPDELMEEWLVFNPA